MEVGKRSGSQSHFPPSPKVPMRRVVLQSATASNRKMRWLCPRVRSTKHGGHSWNSRRNWSCLASRLASIFSRVISVDADVGGATLRCHLRVAPGNAGAPAGGHARRGDERETCEQRRPTVRVTAPKTHPASLRTRLRSERTLSGKTASVKRPKPPRRYSPARSTADRRGDDREEGLGSARAVAKSGAFWMATKRLWPKKKLRAK